MADGTDGTKDAVQRVRRTLQIRAARAGVQTGFEPDVRDGEALELAPESDGAPATEGGER